MLGGGVQGHGEGRGDLRDARLTLDQAARWRAGWDRHDTLIVKSVWGCSTVPIVRILHMVESLMAVPKPAQPPEPAYIRVLPDGAVTLPPEVVRAAGFAEGDTIAVSLESGGLRLDPAGRSDTALRKQPLLDLYNYFAPVREEVQESGISEDELNELIDEAIAASRRERSRSSE